MMLSACGSYRTADNIVTDSTLQTCDSIVKYDNYSDISSSETNMSDFNDLSIRITQLAITDSLIYPSKIITINQKSSSKSTTQRVDSVQSHQTINQKHTLAKSNKIQEKKESVKKNNIVNLPSLTIYTIIIFSFCILLKKYI